MCYTSQGIHTRVYVGNREQGRRFLANTERHVHAKGGGPQGPFANHPSAHRSLCVTVRMMRVFHAPSAHFSCAAAKADAVWSLSRIENTKQGMAELILIASVMPRGGARWEIGEPICSMCHGPFSRDRGARNQTWHARRARASQAGMRADRGFRPRCQSMKARWTQA